MGRGDVPRTRSVTQLRFGFLNAWFVTRRSVIAFCIARTVLTGRRVPFARLVTFFVAVSFPGRAFVPLLLTVVAMTRTVATSTGCSGRISSHLWTLGMHSEACRLNTWLQWWRSARWQQGGRRLDHRHSRDPSRTLGDSPHILGVNLIDSRNDVAGT